MFALRAVTQSSLTLCNPMDCSPPGTSVYGISQARMMEWVAIPSPGDLTEPGIKPVSPALHADSTTDPLRKPFQIPNLYPKTGQQVCVDQNIWSLLSHLPFS